MHNGGFIGQGGVGSGLVNKIVLYFNAKFVWVFNILQNMKEC